jgi:hypothetical protein
MWRTEFCTRQNLSHPRSKISKVEPCRLFGNTTFHRKKPKEANKRKVIQSADGIRAKHLDERIAAYVLANDMTKEKAATQRNSKEPCTSTSNECSGRATKEASTKYCYQMKHEKASGDQLLTRKRSCNA